MIEDGLVIFSNQQSGGCVMLWIERAPRAAAAVCSDHSSIHTSPVTKLPHDRVLHILTNLGCRFRPLVTRERPSPPPHRCGVSSQHL